MRARNSRRSADFMRYQYRWVTTYVTTKQAIMLGPRDVMELWDTMDEPMQDQPRPEGVAPPMWGKTRFFRYHRDMEPEERAKVQRWPDWVWLPLEARMLK